MFNLNLFAAYLFIALLIFPPEKKAKQFQQRATAWTVDWSHDDKYLAAGNSNGELSVFEAKTGKKIKTWNYPATTITRVEWNPHHPILAVAVSTHEWKRGVIQLYDVKKDVVISTLPDTVLGRSLTWSPDGETIAYAGSKGRITLFSKEGRKKKALTFMNPRSFLDMDWHPTKNWLVGIDEEIFLVDIDADSLIRSFDDGSVQKGILSVQWHPSGDFFVTGDYGHENEGAEPSFLRFWNVNGKMLKQLKESKNEYRNLRWSHDGKHLAAAADVLVLVNQNMQRESILKLGSENLWGLSWNHKGDRIAISDQGGDIKIADLNGNILRTFKQ